MITARDDAVTKMAALIQIVIGYAGGAGAVPGDDHAKTLAQPVVDSLIRAAKSGYMPSAPRGDR